MIPGVTVTLGEVSYILPPLNMAGVKTLKGRIENIFSSGVPDMEVVADAAFLSLKRNYPDITIDIVQEGVDYGNFLDVFDAVMNTSGLVEKVGKMVARFQGQPSTSPTLSPTSLDALGVPLQELGTSGISPPTKPN